MMKNLVYFIKCRVKRINSIKPSDPLSIVFFYQANTFPHFNQNFYLLVLIKIKKIIADKFYYTLHLKNCLHTICSINTFAIYNKLKMKNFEIKI